MKKPGESGSGQRKTNPTEQKDFLKRGQELARPDAERRRENLARLIGSEKFPTWKSLSDALGYKDASRISHLKNGLKSISPSLARGMEDQLGLPKGYFDSDPHGREGSAADHRRAAQRYLNKEASARELATEYGVSEAVIYKWVSELRQTEDTAARQRLIPGVEVSGRSSTDLEEENRKLRAKLVELMLKHDEI